MSETLQQSILVVITGPPGAGKTTSVDLLKRCGSVTMPEVARELIEREQKVGGDIYPWTRLTEFVERLWRAQERQFYTARQVAGPVFFDRSIPDALAFLMYHRAAATDAYIDACRRYRYDLIFDLELLPGYVCDTQRPYSRTEAVTIAWLNQCAYRALGYELIPTPVMPMDARVNFILKETQRRMQQCRGHLPVTTEVCPVDVGQVTSLDPNKKDTI